MIAGMMRVLTVGLVLLVAAMFMLPRPSRQPAPEVATYLPRPLVIPDVPLLGDDGAPRGLDLFRGRYSLLFFGFTHCPDVCPLTLQMLAQARAEIEATHPDLLPQVVFASVDPARDTPERIRAYADNFDPAFVGFTAAQAALVPLTKALGVAVQKHEHGGESYNVVHSSTVYIVGPDANVIAVSSAPHDPKTLAADFLKVRSLHEASRPAA
ncbi:MAG TPA: SCO family protein [Gammaproteobacteria bacterium]